MSCVEELTKTTAIAIINIWKPVIEAAANNGQCSVYIQHYAKVTKTVESKIFELFGLVLVRIDEVCRGDSCNTKTGYLVSW